ADAAAEMISAVARLKVKRLNPPSQGARLAIVDVFGDVESDEDVVIEIARILSGSVAHANHAGSRHGTLFGRANLPRRSAEEFLARHASQRVDQRLRGEAGDPADFLRVETPAFFD